MAHDSDAPGFYLGDSPNADGRWPIGYAQHMSGVWIIVAVVALVLFLLVARRVLRQ